MEEKTLFDQDTELSAPLASRVRPKDFNDFRPDASRGTGKISERND